MALIEPAFDGKLAGVTRIAKSFAVLSTVALLAAAGAAGSAADDSGSRILASGDGIDLLNPVNGRVRKVAADGGEPAFVPGHRAFAYIREGGARGGFTLYSVFVKSLRDHRTAAPGRRLFDWKDFFVREVDVSPNGRLIFAATPGPGPKRGRLDIYSSNLAGQDVRRLTRTPDFENDPVVSPDGRLIAYARKVGGRAQIFVMRIDGSHQRQLTKDGRRDRLPSWSPDGRRLVFIAQPAAGDNVFGRRDLRTVTTGGVERRLTGIESGDVSDPVYSPSGRSIAFLRHESVWLMSARGRQKRLLHHVRGLVGYEGGIDWGNDGR